MPTLSYLSMHDVNIVNEPWQVWVLGALAVIKLVGVIWCVIELRKW